MMRRYNIHAIAWDEHPEGAWVEWAAVEKILPLRDQAASVVFAALQQLKEYSSLWEIHQADGFGCECDFCKLYESLNDDPDPDA